MSLKSLKIGLATIIMTPLLLAGCARRPAGGLPPPNAQLMKPKNRIALLLPLSGRYAKQSQAIRNGFFAAYYYYGRQSLQPQPSMQVFNTSGQTIQQVYQRAVQAGYDFIVGPLLKNKVRALSGSDLTQPTLALNTIPTTSPTTNLYQFGLSPTDDALQIANKASNAGLHNALVIAPATAWGQNIANTFINQWQQNGHKIVAQYHYLNRANLERGVAQLLNIDQSAADARQLQRIINQKVRVIARRRQDFDMIFMVATPSYAHQIVPLLRYFYAGNVPLYATSSIYSGNMTKDRDLNGVIFCDIPWVLDSDAVLGANLSALRTKIQTTWPKRSKQYPKLFALGVDAYTLTNDLGSLTTGAQIHGATGTLSLTANQQVFRQLTWAKVVNGLPQNQ